MTQAYPTAMVTMDPVILAQLGIIPDIIGNGPIKVKAMESTTLPKMEMTVGYGILSTNWNKEGGRRSICYLCASNYRNVLYITNNRCASHINSTKYKEGQSNLIGISSSFIEVGLKH
jgi:hypothetical protein